MASYDPNNLKMLPTTRGTGPLNLPSLIGAGRGTPAPGPIPGVPNIAAPAPGTGPLGSPGGPGSLPTDLMGQAATNLSGALKGELPPDVVNMLQQQAAERGVAGGVPGSQAAEYGGLRTLGLTSLDRMDKATDLLANQFLTPKDQASLALSRDELAAKTKYEQDQLNFQREQEKVRASEEANRLALQKEQFDLQALGGKYGGITGGGGGGGYAGYNYTPVGQRGQFNWATGMTELY